jgi:hypothetical protein
MLDQEKDTIHPNLHSGQPDTGHLDDAERQKLVIELKKSISDGKLYVEDILMSDEVPGDVMVAIGLSEDTKLAPAVIEIFILKMCDYLKSRRSFISWKVQQFLDKLERYLLDKTQSNLLAFSAEKRKLGDLSDTRHFSIEEFDPLRAAKALMTLLLTIEHGNYLDYVQTYNQDDMPDKDMENWMVMGKWEVAETLGQMLRDSFKSNMY